jgi:hypothetical protein
VAGGAPVILRLHRAGGGDLPPEAESVELLEDGSLVGWRSVASGCVGYFAGRLSAAEVAKLAALVANAAAEADPLAPPPPGAPTETLELESRDPVSLASVSASDEGPWAPLAAAARALLDRLADFPQAAIALTLPTPNLAQLEHRGTVPLTLDLSTVRLRATAWRGYYEPAGDWTDSIAGPEQVEAGQGWSYPLPIGLSVPRGADITVHVSAGFTVVAGNRTQAVRVSHTPAVSAAAPKPTS